MATGVYSPPADGSTGYSEDVLQFYSVLTGQRDAGTGITIGTSQLASPISAPSVNTSSSGSITGNNYQWGVYWISGVQGRNSGGMINNIVGRTPYGPLTVAQNLSSKQAVVSISGLSPPTGTIGWGVARNKSGGGTWYEVPSSEQFLTTSAVLPSSFTDNVVDASLVTTAPTTNSTGTSLYQSWSPTLAATTTNPDLGSTGSVAGVYARLGDLVQAWVRFSFSGSSISQGTGTYYVVPPVPLNATFAAVGNFPIGSFFAYDGSTNVVTGIAVTSTVAGGAAILAENVWNAGGADLGASSPLTFASGGYLGLTLTYQAV